MRIKEEERERECRRRAHHIRDETTRGEEKELKVCTSHKKREEREGRSVRITSERIIEKGEEACASRKKREER